MAVDWLQGCYVNHYNSSSLTYYYPLNACYLTYDSTEAPAQTKVRATFTATNLYTYCDTYSSSNACTVRFRKNTADATQLCTVNATGAFEDTTHTDSVTATTPDVINYSATWGNAGHTNTGVRINHISVILEESTGNNNFINLIHTAPSMVPGGAAFITYNGGSGAETVETYAGTTYTAATYSYMFAYATANTRSVGVTLTTRKNAADTTLTISWGASTTGGQEDTTHTVSYSSGDTLSMQLTGSAGTGDTTIANAYVYTNGANYPRWTSGTNVTGSSGVQSYLGVYGGAWDAEAKAQEKARFGYQASNFSVYVRSNTANGSTVYALRKNGSAVLSNTFSSAETGTKVDTTVLSAFSSTDLLNHYIDTRGSSSGYCYCAWVLTEFGYSFGGATSSIKTVEGTTKASVKTMHGTAIASMKTLQGTA